MPSGSVIPGDPVCLSEQWISVGASLGAAVMSTFFKSQLTTVDRVFCKMKEGCRTREANQRACAGTGRVVTAVPLFACEPLSCFHLYLPKTKALPCASDDHPCRGRSVCLSKHEPPNLLGGSYCVIYTGHVRAGTFVQVLRLIGSDHFVSCGCLVCVEPPASLICFQREVMRRRGRSAAIQRSRATCIRDTSK